jgi:pimeloyl-ACP methyl ester carboxylesterase
MMKVFQEKLLIPFGDKMGTMVVRVWQPDESRATVFCIHPFEGRGTDFDYLAQLLVRNGFTVIAPDLIGRGESTFFGDPAIYTIESYLRCLQALSQFAGKVNHFIGTSWGGAILMYFLYLARVRPDKLILNDVGLQPTETLPAVLDFLRKDAAAQFDTLEEARSYVRETRTYLGPVPAEQWEAYLQNKIIQRDGKYRMAYDPAIADNFLTARPYDLFPLLEKIDAPTLLLFGADSHAYDQARVADLIARHPRFSCIPNLQASHHPSLMTYEQALLVVGYLNAP